VLLGTAGHDMCLGDAAGSSGGCGAGGDGFASRWALAQRAFAACATSVAASIFSCGLGGGWAAATVIVDVEPLTVFGVGGIYARGILLPRGPGRRSYFGHTACCAAPDRCIPG
jgi:hypothetical protein